MCLHAYFCTHRISNDFTKLLSTKGNAALCFIVQSRSNLNVSYKEVGHNAERFISYKKKNINRRLNCSTDVTNLLLVRSTGTFSCDVSKISQNQLYLVFCTEQL